MKKVTLFVGMIVMAAFLSTSVLAQDKATAKPAEKPATPAKTETTKGSCDHKDAKKEDCKPGCTMHKDKCCDKDKKTTTPDKK
jgi:hypothetical protein